MYLCVLPPVKINCSSIKMDSPYFLSSLITRSQHSLSHLLYLISVCRCTTESWMQHRYYITMYCYLRCNKTSLRCLWCADVLLESLPQQKVLKVLMYYICKYSYFIYNFKILSTKDLKGHKMYWSNTVGTLALGQQHLTKWILFSQKPKKSTKQT